MADKIKTRCAWCRQKILAHKNPTGEWRLAQHMVRMKATGLLIYCMGSSETVNMPAVELATDEAKLADAGPRVHELDS